MRKTVYATYSWGKRKEILFYWDEMYCPECGSRGMWMNEDEGDYYLGPDFFCGKCRSSGHISFGECDYEPFQSIFDALSKKQSPLG